MVFHVSLLLYLMEPCKNFYEVNKNKGLAHCIQVIGQLLQTFKRPKHLNLPFSNDCLPLNIVEVQSVSVHLGVKKIIYAVGL
jgi:hypothetical protein